MDMSAEHRSKFAALQGQCWHLHMKKKFLKCDEKPEANIHTNIYELMKMNYYSSFLAHLSQRIKEIISDQNL